MSWTNVFLCVLGIFVGGFGTLVGTGGGFMLTPILLLLYPHESAETISSISLAVVFFNAGSGSIAYGHQRRIDYRSGLVFAASTLPGAIAGSLLVSSAPRRLFDGIMAGLLGALATWLLVAGRRLSPRGSPRAGSDRVVTDAAGHEYRYRVPMGRGIGFSLGVGFVSSFFGIGGGIIHVPVLVHALGFPVHVATATSQFVLLIMSGAGTTTHIAAGGLDHAGAGRTMALALGAVAGAQLGARLSRRIAGRGIERLLAVALIVLAARVAVSAL